MDLIPTPSPGLVEDLISRLRRDISWLELQCQGYYITHPTAVADLKDAAERLEALTQPRKGYLQHDARRLDNAA